MATLSEIGQAYRSAARANANALASGDIGLPQWYDRQRRAIAGMHVGVYQTGFGRPVESPQRLAITTVVEGQLQYLDTWRDQLQGARDIDADVLYARSLLYLAAAAATYGRATTDRLGLPPLPAYPGDATTACHIGCRCYWSITATGEGNADCRWIMRPAEHCPNCRRRAEEWNPLRIRGGVIQSYSQIGIYRSAR